MKSSNRVQKFLRNLVAVKFTANETGGNFSETAYGSAFFAQYEFNLFYLQRGNKHYELTNHLGNVLTVITDKRLLSCMGDTLQSSFANIVSATDYSPFGAPLAGRTFSSEGYRFGFNGQEKDDEVSGAGNTMTAEFWEYDSRLGRRWNLDPICSPSHSLYVGFFNNPIGFCDPSGLKIINGNRVKSEEARSKSKNLKSEVSGLDIDRDKEKIESLNEQIRGQDGIAAYQEAMADKVDKVIVAYKKVDEDGFNKFDNLKNAGGEKVDIYLDMDYGYIFSEGYLGATEFNYEKDPDGRRIIAGAFKNGDKWMRPASEKKRVNTVYITLDARVAINPYDGGKTVAHEFGHAEYMIINTYQNYKYVKINYSQVLIHGGHGDGDPSGNAARNAEAAFKEKLKIYKKQKK